VQFDLEILVINEVAPYGTNINFLSEWFIYGNYYERVLGTLLKVIFNYQQNKQANRYIQTALKKLIFFANTLFIISSG
jgi:hypothetical protein